VAMQLSPHSFGWSCVESTAPLLVGPPFPLEKIPFRKQLLAPGVK
jgi:hypothetical protein